jgi:tRNA-splicing ligase RtcB
MLNELSDQNTISQIYEFLNHPAFTNPMVLMPDLHYGAGVVIGFTMEMTDMIIPNVVGVDINCAMRSLFLGHNVLSELSREYIDSEVRKRIPFGPETHPNTHYAHTMLDHHFWKNVCESHRKFTMSYNKKYGTSYHPVAYDIKWFEDKCKQIGMDFGRALKSIGTLGGGNHFLELGKLESTGEYLFTIHSGSRQFGLKICTFWQRTAGKGPLAYLTGDDMFGYLTDMVFAQQYASTNRETMANIIEDILNIKHNDQIETSHNFMDFQDFIIRKGAVRSYKGERIIIPFNMEDGLIICEGKSNPEWNFSAPHGAGRVSSRGDIKRKMKKTSSQKIVQERMMKKGIYTSAVPLDETKEAYKDPKIIEEAIEPTATIIDRALPVLNMKSKK